MASPRGGAGANRTSARLLILLAAATVVVAVYVVRWAIESSGEIAQSDFVPLQVAGVIVRGGQAAQLYDPVVQARVYAAVTHADHAGTLFYIHAPLAAALMVPISLVELGVAFHLMGLVQLACLVAGAVIAALAAPPRAHGWAITALAAAVGLALPSTLLMLREGQDVGLAALLLAGAYVAMRRDRLALSGALLAVAALAGKPHLFVGIAVWIVFWGNRRLIAGAAGGAVAAALLSVAALGPTAVGGFVAALLSGRSDFPNSQESLGGVFSAWLGAGRVATGLTVMVTLVALAGIAVAARRGAARRWTLERSLAIGVALTLLVAPHLYPHDLALLTPPFAWMTVVTLDADQRRRATSPGAITAALLAVWVLLATCMTVDAVAALPAAAGALAPYALVTAAIAASRLRTAPHAWPRHRIIGT